MKYPICFFYFFFGSLLVEAQIKAITENGDTLAIYPDGTWDYWENSKGKNIFDSGTDITDLKTNPKNFVKPQKALSKLTGVNENYEVWYDNAKWQRIPPANINSIAENTLTLKGSGKDGYAMIIFEKIEVPLDMMLNVAVINAQKTGATVKILDKEFRNVNGKKVLCATMAGNLKGIEFIYYSYYYSDANGTLQFVSFTGKSLFEDLKADMENLLNGLVLK